MAILATLGQAVPKPVEAGTGGFFYLPEELPGTVKPKEDYEQ